MAGLGFARQDAQLGSTRDTIVGFDDTVAPTLANYETNAGNLATDMNNVRSMLSYLKDIQAGNWYDAQTAPSALEAGSLRGVDDVNDALHLVEKKRFLICLWTLNSISIASAGDTFDILALSEIPGNTQARVGVQTGLGTVVADHSAAFGAASLLEVAGSNAIRPQNLVQIVDAATRDPILDVGDRIYGLLQGEGAADFVITGTTPVRVQISFVKINGTGDDLIAITSGAMDGKSYDYCYPERVRFEDLPQDAFLGAADTDVPSGTVVTRQAAYDGQTATPVELGTNATLDIGSGLFWELRDLANQTLVRVTEGSGGGTTAMLIDADVDTYVNDALDIDFDQGISVGTGLTRPIDIGETDGVVETTAGDMKLLAAALLALEDTNKGASTYATDLVLSDSSAEWSTFDTNFGEVSLLNAINQAFSGQVRTKVQATVTAASIAADTDVNGPGTAHANTDVDLAPFDLVTFVDDVEVFLNGELLVNAAGAFTTEGVRAGGTPVDGDLKFNGVLRGTGVNPDRITVIVNGQ